mgnify:FL=1
MSASIDDHRVTPSLSSDVALVRRYGGAVSHSTLDPVCQTFRIPEIDGFIGFHLHHGCAVAMGDPICSPTEQEILANAFIDYAASQGWTVIFAVASDALRPLMTKVGGAMVQVADLLIADAQQDPLQGPRGSHLRTSTRLPLREGVLIHEYDGNAAPDPVIEERVMAAMESWRTHRTGFQLHIGSHLVFRSREGCRWLLAEQGDKVCGILTMMRINTAGCGLLIDLVLSTPSAPPHTNELLIVSAFHQLKREFQKSVCLGVAPRAMPGEIIGFGPISTRLARFFYYLTMKLSPQHGKAAFWKKFGITRREPLYMMFLTPKVGLREFRALIKTFNGAM